jgi:hypothetical protein
VMSSLSLMANKETRTILRFRNLLRTVIEDNLFASKSMWWPHHPCSNSRLWRFLAQLSRSRWILPLWWGPDNEAWSPPSAGRVAPPRSQDDPTGGILAPHGRSWNWKYAGSTRSAYAGFVCFSCGAADIHGCCSRGQEIKIDR